MITNSISDFILLRNSPTSEQGDMYYIRILPGIKYLIIKKFQSSPLHKCMKFNTCKME